MPACSASMTASAPADGFLSNNFLCEKGSEQCDSSKYLVPWHGTNVQGDKAVSSEFGNIPDDRPRGCVSTCGSIDEDSADRGDKPARENNRCRAPF
ncbi:MAG: hypothetical protein HN350_20235 [Phycisphaerales bacterium]|nr:hypothetical protein [Phycisphaerales bacterium]